MTYRLGGACRILDEQAGVDAVRWILSDDEGGDPYQRLVTVRRLLSELGATLGAAGALAQRLDVEASHLGVEVDPEAPDAPHRPGVTR